MVSLMNCDICDRDVPESTLMSIGEILWMDRKQIEIFVCEECAQKVSNALAKRKETDKEQAMTNTENPRQTQFQGFAKALFDQLYDQFNNLHYQEDDGRDKEAEQTREGILETIAEAGYDLAAHTIDQITLTTRELYTDRELLELIPDLTELPKDNP